MTSPRRAILIVDDEVLMVKTLGDILRMRGWDVQGAHSGEDAVAYLRGGDTVDVVLMDVRMGGMTGVDALRLIRQEHPTLPVMLMTAYSTAELLADAERQGAVQILSKPVAVPGLIEILDGITEARRVLVVDDNPAYLTTVADILRAHGYAALRAQNLDDALELLAQSEPGVVLLDLRLETVDPATSVLAIHRADPSVVLILYSGSESAIRESESNGLASIAHATLRKPFAPTELLGVLEEAFGG
jgi:DNA-binding NtrC family response regulator